NTALNNRLQSKRDTVLDPFQILDRLFLKNFRLTKHVAIYLIDILSPHINVGNRSSSLNVNNKVIKTYNIHL
ncbi:Uncharacterized protein FWK35_00039301, partial [Aphis craccivora]